MKRDKKGKNGLATRIATEIRRRDNLGVMSDLQFLSHGGVVDLASLDTGGPGPNVFLTVLGRFGRDLKHAPFFLRVPAYLGHFSSTGPDWGQ